MSRETLRAAAALATVRLEGACELDRVARLDAALQAGRRLASSLAAFTRHATAEYRGSHSTWDLGAEADAVADALRAYALALAEIEIVSMQMSDAR